jgi:5-methylcytosine-specific restriction endonuclease McrA
MPEIDFYTFGIVPNDALLERITCVLDRVHAYGDFELRSARLYYGTISAASQALGIPMSHYREALRGSKGYTKGKGIAFDSMSNELLNLLCDGASMILEMSDTERMALFPERRQPRIVKEAFVKKVELWRAEQLPNQGRVALCLSLLERYKRMWRYRHHPRVVFESAVSDPLKVILRSLNSIESRANESEVCAVAMEIVGEYETYRWHRDQISNHVKIQRKILDRKRSLFLNALILRDGKKCANPICGSTKKLRIDHIDPLSRGGSTEVDNLQILCVRCNSKKRNKTPQLDRVCEPAMIFQRRSVAASGSQIVRVADRIENGQ